MNKEAISKFQMRAYKTLHFDFTTPLNNNTPVNQITHDFIGSFMIDHVDNKWVGMVVIQYTAKNNSDEPRDKFGVNTIMHGYYDYDAENTESERQQFTRLLKMNGALALLSIMRGQVAAATTALGLNPGLIVPSVNLNHFEWVETPVRQQNED